MSLSAMRRWHRRWFIPIEIGALLLVFGYWWITSWSPMGRLRASGAPVSFADLVPEPIPDSENGAAGLRDAAEPLAAFDAALVAFYQTNEGAALDQIDGLDPTPEASLAALRRFVADHDEAAGLVQDIASRGSYVSLLTPAAMADQQQLIAHVRPPRSAARAAHLLQRVQLAAGDAESALATAVGTLRFGKMLEAEPFMINRLIAVAIQNYGLQQAERMLPVVVDSDKQRARLDAALSRVEDRSSLEFALVSERVQSLHTIGQMPINVLLYERSNVLEAFEESLRLNAASSQETAKAARLGIGNPPSLAPALESLFVAELRMVAKARCVRVALALVCSGGPATPDALGLPPETLRDPYNDQPLRVEKLARGAWRVESCGPDQLRGDPSPGEAMDNLIVETP